MGEAELQPALVQIEALQRQLEVIDQAQKADYDALGRVVGVPLEKLDREVANAAKAAKADDRAPARA